MTPASGSVFQTSDGYKLTRQEDGTWSDGDLTFDAGGDGLPVEEGGEPLEGKLLS